MTQQEFIKPSQCNNCEVLRERIEDYYKISDSFTNSAFETGMKLERTAREEKADTDELQALAELSKRRLDAAALVGESMRETLQKDLNIIGTYCMGTDDPISPELQACNNIQNQFR